MRHITLLARPELRLLRVKSNRRIIPVNPNAVIAAAFKGCRSASSGASHNAARCCTGADYCGGLQGRRTGATLIRLRAYLDATAERLENSAPRYRRASFPVNSRADGPPARVLSMADKLSTKTQRVANHQPLNRQSECYAREAGSNSRSGPWPIRSAPASLCSQRCTS